MRLSGIPIDFLLCQLHNGTVFGMRSVYKRDSTWGNQGHLRPNSVGKAEMLPTDTERKIQVYPVSQVCRVCIDNWTGRIVINIRLVHSAEGSLVRRVGGARGLFVRVCGRFNIDGGLRPWRSGVAWEKWVDTSVLFTIRNPG
jgi:hypothetical protein